MDVEKSAAACSLQLTINHPTSNKQTNKKPTATAEGTLTSVQSESQGQNVLGSLFLSR